MARSGTSSVLLSRRRRSVILALWCLHVLPFHVLPTTVYNAAEIAPRHAYRRTAEAVSCAALCPGECSLRGVAQRRAQHGEQAASEILPVPRYAAAKPEWRQVTSYSPRLFKMPKGSRVTRLKKAGLCAVQSTLQPARRPRQRCRRDRVHFTPRIEIRLRRLSDAGGNRRDGFDTASR